MDAYAIVKDGIVINVVEWDGTPYTPAVAPRANGEGGSPATGWNPPDGTTAFLIEKGQSPCIGLGYADGVFEQPAPPLLTLEDIQKQNTAMRNALLAIATAAIAPLQDAIDLDEATADEAALLTAWKQYRVAVNRVDPTAAPPTWPRAPA